MFFEKVRFLAEGGKAMNMITLASEKIEDLEQAFNEIAIDNPREAAEVAFALACFYHEKDDIKAREFAERSIKLFENCKTDTLEQCAAMHTFICGIPIPELIHEGVVRFRFADLLSAQ